MRRLGWRTSRKELGHFWRRGRRSLTRSDQRGCCRMVHLDPGLHVILIVIYLVPKLKSSPCISFHQHLPIITWRHANNNPQSTSCVVRCSTSLVAKTV